MSNAVVARPASNASPLAGALGPHLARASGLLWREVQALHADGQLRRVALPLERALTLYLDKQERVTLMTLGQWPELLVLGYLLNQGLIADAQALHSISVDWESQAAVRTHWPVAELAAKTARRVITTGCGQGTVFGDQMAQLQALPVASTSHASLRLSDLKAMLEAVRAQPSVHREAGSVHGCGLFQGAQLLAFVEDVGRRNAIDSIAGWTAVNQVSGGDKVFYTTGRLTSEMVMKAARMGLPIVVSRNGATAMGLDLALQRGMILVGRVAPQRFICYCGVERLDAVAAADPPPGQETHE